MPTGFILTSVLYYGRYGRRCIVQSFRINYFLGAAVEPVEQVDITCANGASTEEYVYHFPKGLKILSMPQDMSVKNDFLSCRATYRLKGGVLTVKRVLEDRTIGNVCSPAVFEAYRKFAVKALQNVKSQVVYK